MPASRTFNRHRLGVPPLVLMIVTGAHAGRAAEFEIGVEGEPGLLIGRSLAFVHLLEGQKLLRRTDHRPITG